jgi:hypothetical protein
MTASDLRSGAAVAAEPQAVQACLSRILEGSDFPALSGVLNQKFVDKTA